MLGFFRVLLKAGKQRVFDVLLGIRSLTHRLKDRQKYLFIAIVPKKRHVRWTARIERVALELSKRHSITICVPAGNSTGSR